MPFFFSFLVSVAKLYRCRSCDLVEVPLEGRPLLEVSPAVVADMLNTPDFWHIRWPSSKRWLPSKFEPISHFQGVPVLHVLVEPVVRSRMVVLWVNMLSLFVLLLLLVRVRLGEDVLRGVLTLVIQPEWRS